MSSTTPFGSPQPPNYVPLPPQKSGGGVLKIILIVGGIVVLGGAICCGGCIWIGKTTMNKGFEMLTESAKSKYGNHPDVIDKIGADAEFTHDFWKSVEESKNGDQVLVFPVKGSKGEGEIIAKQMNEQVTGGRLRTPQGEYPLE